MHNFCVLVITAVTFTTTRANEQEFHIYNPPDGRCRDTKGRVYEAGMKWFDDLECELRECIGVPSSDSNMEKYWKCPELVEDEEDEEDENCHWLFRLGHYPECCPEKICLKTPHPGKYSFEDSESEGSEDSESEGSGDSFDSDGDDGDNRGEGSGGFSDDNDDEEEEGSGPGMGIDEVDEVLDKKEDEGSLSLSSEEINNIFANKHPDYNKYTHDDVDTGIEDSDSFEFNELPGWKLPEA